MLESKAGHTINVAPAAPEIVVQDPYSVAVPKRAILSNDGVYLLQIFEDSYQVYHLATGSKLVERPGHDPNFSPTGRFVAANTGAEGGSSFEVTDLLSRQQIPSVSGAVIGWTESDAFLIAAQAGSWAKLSVMPTLISSGADNAGESFTISEASPDKNTPSWEAFGVTIGIDAGTVAFSREKKPGFFASKEQTSAYELATGYQFAAAPPSKGWHARGPINFSHVYDPATDKINNREWAREQAKSKVLKELRKLKVSHRVLDQQALAEFRKPSNVRLALGDWRTKTLGRGWGDEGTARESFVGELGRFGVVIAGEVPRQEFPPAISAVWRSKQSEPSGLDSDRVKTLANTLKGRLAGEIPASNEILKEGMLSSKSIDLERHLEGLWRWDVQGQPVWVLEGVDNQGSGGFAEVDSWLLQRNTSNQIASILQDAFEEYNPHINEVDDNTIRLKPRIFQSRYLVIGIAGPKAISILDLKNGSSVTHYWSSYEGAHFVHLRFPGLSQLASFQQFASVLNRPDIIKDRLGKAPPPVPQTNLTPPPVLDLDAMGNPDAQSPSGEDQVRVSARSPVGLTRLRFYHDGQLVRDEPVTGGEFQASVSLPHSRHARWLTALATDTKGVVSAPRALRLNPEGDGTNKLYAVIAGVDRYASPSINLTYAKSDASRLASALEARGTSYYAKQNVELLLDNAATRGSIAAALERAAGKARPEDTVLFYFAGHGVQGKDGRYYLTPSDLDLNNIERTGLPWSEIAAILEKAKARAVVILDSCHSGLSGAEGLTTNDDAVKALLSGARAPLLALAASKGREFSFEGPEWQGGIFTYALTKALQDNPGAGQRKEAIDVSDLYRKLHQIIARETHGGQTPWLARQDLIGDFALF